MWQSSILLLAILLAAKCGFQWLVASSSPNILPMFVNNKSTKDIPGPLPPKKLKIFKKELFYTKS